MAIAVLRCRKFGPMYDTDVPVLTCGAPSSFRGYLITDLINSVNYSIEVTEFEG
jgi:hypothetical protein